jgi:uncharacterized membrane protein YhhN
MLVATAVVAGAVTIGARLQQTPLLEWVAKPLATVAILLLALGAPPLPTARYRGLIGAGLICSLAGDILLMLPTDLFLAGLVAFLAAHVCYLTAFRSDGGGGGPVGLLVLVVLAGAGVLSVLWPSLGAMRVPVLLYVAVILTMCWMALGRWWVTRAPGSGLAAAGAVFFVVSDSILALDRFHSPVVMAPVLVLGTYYAAQVLIASSVGMARRG